MTVTTSPLTSALVRQLLASAVAAPSVHNTQPWRFQPDTDRIKVYADTTRQLRVQDPDGRALLMSCGAALLNLRLAAEHYGRSSQTEILPDPDDENLVAIVDLAGSVVPSGMVNELYAAIPHRHTNRSPYEDRPVPSAVLEALGEAARQEGATLHPVTDPGERRRLVDLIHDADANTDARAIEESRRWTGVPGDRTDGVPVRALGPIPKSPATPHRDLAPGRPISGRGFAVFETDPTLAVLSTPYDDRVSWVKAGQALQRVLLVATVAGLVATFANQPLEAHELRWLVRDPEQPIAFPQMLLRIGYAPSAPPTPRRPLEEVIVDGEAMVGRPR